MRIALLGTMLALAISQPGCNGGSGDDDDGGAGNGDGGSSSAGVVAIESVSPDHGPLPGGTLVTITGQGFLLANAQPDSVLMGGVDCGPVQLIDDRTLKVVTPPGMAAGPVDVIVYNSNGFDTAAGAYSYNPLPTVTAVTADNGSAAGGETVTITGTGFQALEAGANTVFFGENQASDVTVASDTSMTVTTPPGEPFALVDVAVVNDNGAGEKAKAYEYNATGDTIVALSRAGGTGCGCEYAGKPSYFGTKYADLAQPLEVTTLFSVDPTTGAVASIGESETWITGLATSPTGTVYGVVSNKGPEPLRNYLVTLDVATGAVTPIGPTGVVDSGGYAVNTQDITFAGTILFGIAWRAGTVAGVHTINPLTGAAVGIGGTNLTSGGNGLVYDGTTLYNSNGNAFCEIESSTGTALNCKSGNALYMNAMTMANGKMYGATPDFWDNYASALMEIDQESGVASQVASIPGRVTGMATIP